jgi:hypothetical protein
MFVADCSEQSEHDMAITVHPDDADTIIVRGSSVPAQNRASDAALSFTRAKPPAHPNAVLDFIDPGLYPDVNQVRFAKDYCSLHVWMCGGGGVFRREWR